jgi:hypothetical protein
MSHRESSERFPSRLLQQHSAQALIVRTFSRVALMAFMLVAISGQQAFAAEPLVFDAFAAKGKPADLPVKPMHIIYQWQGYGGPATGNEDKNYAEPPHGVLVCCYKDRVLNGASPEFVSIDFEQWRIDTRVDESVYNKHKKNMIDTLAMVRTMFPDSKIGWYNLGPSPVLNVFREKISPEEFALWRSGNDRVLPFIPEVDFMQPSLYLHTYVSLEQWKRKAVAVVAETKRLAPGVPVYAHISPHWMDGGQEFFPAEIWREMMDWSLANTDGVVIWTNPTMKPLPSWDGNAVWWQSTLNSMQAFREQTKAP